MYIINQVVEDYEGTWSNALMYESDINLCKEIADGLQEATISLKRKLINIQKEVNIELKKKFPNYGNNDLDFDSQLKSIDSDDVESYFDQEDRLFNELTTGNFTDKELFMYKIYSMRYSTGIIYFEVQKLKTSTEALDVNLDKDKFWAVEYSTKDNAKQETKLFDKLIIE